MSTQPLTPATLKKGGCYNWKNQPERLVYIGMCEPRNGRWHQFEKVGEPGVVWCEVTPSDLHMLEETADAAPTDTDRLDWLEEDRGRLVTRIGGTWYTRKGYGTTLRKAKSLRAAIDTARGI